MKVLNFYHHYKEDIAEILGKWDSKYIVQV